MSKSNLQTNELRQNWVKKPTPISDQSSGNTRQLNSGVGSTKWMVWECQIRWFVKWINGTPIVGLLILVGFTEVSGVLIGVIGQEFLRSFGSIWVGRTDIFYVGRQGRMETHVKGPTGTDRRSRVNLNITS